jgi:hypothetical protein
MDDNDAMIHDMAGVLSACTETRELRYLSETKTLGQFLREFESFVFSHVKDAAYDANIVEAFATFIAGEEDWERAKSLLLIYAANRAQVNANRTRKRPGRKPKALVVEEVASE